MSELKFNFEKDEDMEDFTAWFFDGGGEDSLAEYCEIREEGYFSSEMVDGEVNMTRPTE